MPISSKVTAESLSLILDAIPVPVFVKDRESRILAMNKACEDQWGLDFQSLEMNVGDAFFPKDQIAGFLEKDREIFHEGKAVDFEEQVWNHKLQQNRASHTFKSPIYDAAGEPQMLVCVLIDITAQKDAIASLRLNKEKLRSLYELAPLGIALTTMSGKYIEFNDAFRRICGYSPAELAELDYWKLTPPEYAAQEEQQLEAMAATGRYGPYEKEYVHSSGTRVPLRLNGVLVTGGDGEKYIWSIVEDISEQKKAEERLRQSQKLEAVGQLTAGIAHDFNNILSVVMGNIELMAQDETLSDHTRERLAGATSAAKRAASLTEHLLAFSRKQNLSPTLIDLGVEVQDVGAMLRRLIPESIALEINVASRPAPVFVDKNQFGHALINLAVNARDAMKDGGTLRISVDTEQRKGTGLEGGHAVITVEDTGHGMPDDLLAKAFDPFFTTKESGQGSGLGLSMVYGFMRQSHGQALLASTVGKGTTVTLLFPLAEDKRIETAGENTPRTTAPARSPRKVLVVEDMDDVRAVITEQLEHLGLNVTTANDGPAAIAALEATDDVDLLLTDLGMPGGMSGLDLAKIAATRYPRIKILLMSGYNSPDITGTDERKFSKRLRKPFDLAELSEAIKSVFET